MSSPLIDDMNIRMKKSLLALREEMSSLRTGRASAAILDHIVVEAYGSRLPLNQVATINVPEARLITVQPWDKTNLKHIEKAIRESDLGLNPINDGMLLRVPLPELTEERRRDLVKVVHKYGEQAKIAIRNIRREGMDGLKRMEKNKEISKDDHHLLEKDLQERTDRFIKEVEEVVAAKEADVMQV